MSAASFSLLERKLVEIDESRYLQRLGLVVASARDGTAEVALPDREANANRGGAVHGGAIASLLIVGGSLAAASTQQAGEPADGRPLTVSVSYLSAARHERVESRARVLRRGRDTVHVESDAAAADGRRVASSLLVYGIDEHGCEAGTPGAAVGAGFVIPDEVAGDARLARSPYGRAAGIEALEAGSALRGARMPLAINDDGAGHVHEGALAGLVDNLGALSAYAHPEVTDDARGSTVAMHLAYPRRAGGDVCGSSRLVAKAGVAFTNEVEVWSESDRRVCVVASVAYRIADLGGG